MRRDLTYLDHAATTPMRPAAVDAMMPFLAGTFGNPSGGHAIARAAKTALEEAREEIAGLLGAGPSELVFTAGGSEADNDSFYDSVKELQGWVNDLKPGMKKGEVFARLGRRQEEFERLTRSDIVGVLFGGKDAGIPTGFTPPGGENIARFLNSLEGYRMVYKKVKRKHGFTSPIRVRKTRPTTPTQSPASKSFLKTSL